jgi:hypothetical protein
MSLLTCLSFKTSLVQFFDMMRLLTANLYITLNSALTELCHKIKVSGWVLGLGTDESPHGPLFQDLTLCSSLT